MKTLLLPSLLALLVLSSAPSARATGEGSDSRRHQTILVTMNHVVGALMPRILAQSESPRLTAGDGLLGLGSYEPPGGLGWGFPAPPLHLVPTAHLGVSLNVNPVTGRLY
jgi:hypothetical protein